MNESSTPTTTTTTPVLSPQEIIVGIDFGSSSSTVSVWRGGKVTVIPNSCGRFSHPSEICFFHPKENIKFSDFKRIIGRSYLETSSQFKYHSPNTVCGKGGKTIFNVNYNGKERIIFPETLYEISFRRIKFVTESFVGCTVTQAVITVPSQFTDKQKKITKQAATVAGFSVLRIMNQSSASALSFGYLSPQKECTILIFDLGGGTLEASIVSIDDGFCEVIATGGDTKIGGEDFDTKLVEFFCDEFRRKFRIDLKNHPRSIQRMRLACERIKRALSLFPETSIEIENLCNGLDFFERITRKEFEFLCQNLFDTCTKHIRSLLNEAKFSVSVIDHVLLLGSSTKIPKIKEILESIFEKNQLDQVLKIDPEIIPTFGATLQGAILSGHDTDDINLQNVVLVDVATMSFGLEIAGTFFQI